jgi:hypothetical protein
LTWRWVVAGCEGGGGSCRGRSHVLDRAAVGCRVSRLVPEVCRSEGSDPRPAWRRQWCVGAGIAMLVFAQLLLSHSRAGACTISSSLCCFIALINQGGHLAAMSARGGPSVAAAAGPAPTGECGGKGLSHAMPNARDYEATSSSGRVDRAAPSPGCKTEAIFGQFQDA